MILHKSILRHQSGDEVSGLLGRSLSVRVGHVDAVETKLLGVTHGPLEVVQEGPGVVASDWYPVIHDGLQHLVGVVFVIVNPAVEDFIAPVVTLDLELPLEIVQVGEQVREAVLCDVDVWLVELPAGPVDGLSDAPGSHLQPAGRRHEPGLVLLSAVGYSHKNYFFPK